jgi:metal-responsive CopG/Arc/MetJ family transcriptional regulator
MKTAISIPDKIYRDAERLSRRLKKSRSQVYTEAVTEYIARHDPEAVTEAMNHVCKMVDTRPDPALAAAARRTLEAVEW